MMDWQAFDSFSTTPHCISFFPQSNFQLQALVCTLQALQCTLQALQCTLQTLQYKISSMVRRKKIPICKSQDSRYRQEIRARKNYPRWSAPHIIFSRKVWK